MTFQSGAGSAIYELPQELLEQIFLHLKSLGSLNPDFKSDLVACSAVCRAWVFATRPIIFRRIKLYTLTTDGPLQHRSPRIRQGIDIFTKNPSITMHVREVWIRAPRASFFTKVNWNTSLAFFHDTFRLLSLLPNVVDLAFRDFTLHAMENKRRGVVQRLFQNLQPRPSLKKNLKIGQLITTCLSNVERISIEDTSRTDISDLVLFLGAAPKLKILELVRSPSALRYNSMSPKYLTLLTQRMPALKHLSLDWSTSRQAEMLTAMQSGTFNLTHLTEVSFHLNYDLPSTFQPFLESTGARLRVLSLTMSTHATPSPSSFAACLRLEDVNITIKPGGNEQTVLFAVPSYALCTWILPLLAGLPKPGVLRALTIRSTIQSIHWKSLDALLGRIDTFSALEHVNIGAVFTKTSRFPGILSHEMVPGGDLALQLRQMMPNLDMGAQLGVTVTYAREWPFQ